MDAGVTGIRGLATGVRKPPRDGVSTGVIVGGTATQEQVHGHNGNIYIATNIVFQ